VVGGTPGAELVNVTVTVFALPTCPLLTVKVISNDLLPPAWISCVVVQLLGPLLDQPMGFEEDWIGAGELVRTAWRPWVAEPPEFLTMMLIV
jgi:hypothetical protein